MTESDPHVSSRPAADRVLTVPNAISFLRLLGVPVFLWLALGPKNNWAAFGVLVAAGVSDYVDGKLARILGQTSRLGELLDPAADRLYIAATLIALAIRGIVPWWLVIAIAARDVALALCIPVLRRHGYGSALPVHFMGKAATFALLYAFPMLLLSRGGSVLAQVVRPIGWACALWGVGMYWWAGALYFVQVRQLVSADRASAVP